MKIIRIALKDLTRSFRSAFLLAFMFAIPLLVTGMFYLMFGNQPAESASQGSSPAMLKIVVAVANLDTGSPALSEGLALLSPGSQAAAPAGDSLGDLLVSTLQSESFSGMVEVQPVNSAAAARQAVDSRQAGAALIIPSDFSSAYVDSQNQASLELYQDPEQVAGGMLLRSILGPFTDMLSGMKIALGVSLSHTASANGSPDLASLAPVIQQYSAWAQAITQDPSTLAELRSPAPASSQPSNPLTQMIGPILSGMLIFFAFFTGGATAQSILTEAEEGTLARLFTTPTPLSTILGGKFLSVGLTVLVQVTVQLVAGALIFGIHWGSLGVTVLAALGIVACATAFGIFLTSLLKSTRQGGIVYGGLMTVTGMLGMMSIFSPNSLGQTVSLFVPQGWAIRGLGLGLSGAGGLDPWLNLLVVLVWSAVFFSIGLLRFQKRFA